MSRTTVPTELITGGWAAQRGSVSRAARTATLLVLLAATAIPAPPWAEQSGVDDQAAGRPGVVAPATPGLPVGPLPVGADGDSTAFLETSAGGVVNAGYVERLPAGGGSTNGIPASVLAAYRRAAAELSRTQPGCRLPMALLAAIGKVESGHARGGRVDSAGTTLSPILGPVLAGQPGVMAIRDTDGGRLDGDAVWDRAVGPMQFIPGTWARWATDGNGDGVASPHNVVDASQASGRYLCAGGRDLGTADGLRSGILSYNRSEAYLRLVLAWMRQYSAAATPVPDAGGSMPGDAGSTGDAGTAPADPAPGRPPSETPGEPAPGAPPQAPQPGDGGQAPEPPPGAVPPPTAPPAVPPSPTDPEPEPVQPGPVETVVCVVDGVVDDGLGLIGGLIGAPPGPAPSEDCQP